MLERIRTFFSKLYKILRPLVGGGGGPVEPLDKPPPDGKA